MMSNKHTVVAHELDVIFFTTRGKYMHLHPYCLLSDCALVSHGYHCREYVLITQPVASLLIQLSFPLSSLNTPTDSIKKNLWELPQLRLTATLIFLYVCWMLSQSNISKEMF